MEKYRLVDYFISLQGEGLNIGKMSLFLRFFGCNEKCSYCDEPLHRISSKAKEYSREEVFNIVESYKDSISQVIITGGEPSLYNLNSLIAEIQDYYRLVVQVESNGHNLNNIKESLFITISPKNIQDFLKDDNKEFLPFVKEVKIPYYFLGVEEYIDLILKEEGLKEAIIWLTLINREKELNLRYKGEALEVIKKNPRIRLNIQAHKVWGLE